MKQSTTSLITSKDKLSKLDLNKYIGSGLEITIKDLSGNVIVDTVINVEVSGTSTKSNIGIMLNSLVDAIDITLENRLRSLEAEVRSITKSFGLPIK